MKQPPQFKPNFYHAGAGEWQQAILPQPPPSHTHPLQYKQYKAGVIINQIVFVEAQ